MDNTELILRIMWIGQIALLFFPGVSTIQAAEAATTGLQPQRSKHSHFVHSTVLPLKLLTTGFSDLPTSFMRSVAAEFFFSKAPHALHLFLPLPTVFFATRCSGQCPAVGVSTSLLGFFWVLLPGYQWLIGSMVSSSIGMGVLRRFGAGGEKPAQMFEMNL